MKLNNKQYSRLLLMIEAQLANMKEYGFTPTDKNIMPTIEQIIKLAGIPCDEDDKKALFTDIEYAESITHKLGDCIFDYYEQKKWYFNETVEDSYFWDRYYRYLKSHTSIDDKSIELLNNKTLPDIMNCLLNPKEDSKAKRLKRGLIIGDVQSGKTATYSGLICKAADAGYKVVILLAGITESLRQQTQERIDEGIVGFTIRKVTKIEVSGTVGVGEDNKQRRASSFTSCIKDFVKGSHLISTSLSEHNSLVLFVVKKNVSVLTKLHDWLRDQNMDVVTQSINHPMLLIDDEADNASVNTKKDDTDPTKTNAIIRKICNLFQTANYVGFTATPFANVFIDPDSVDSMKNADLFHEHFIYTLPTPSTYIGADKIFYEDKEYYKNLRFITDIEEPDYTSYEYRETVKENIQELNEAP
ncbi:MAG: DEAD/DEAH box helicase family protein, partial [Bacteroidales bacterium]|nr:DEAD/DEAH box helicase family protein [Bacteroidales bacterium]